MQSTLSNLHYTRLHILGNHENHGMFQATARTIAVKQAKLLPARYEIRRIEGARLLHRVAA
jgi:hypothetical protein